MVARCHKSSKKKKLPWSFERSNSTRISIQSFSRLGLLRAAAVGFIPLQENPALLASQLMIALLSSFPFWWTNTDHCHLLVGGGITFPARAEFNCKLAEVRNSFFLSHNQYNQSSFAALSWSLLRYMSYVLHYSSKPRAWELEKTDLRCGFICSLATLCARRLVWAHVQMNWTERAACSDFLISNNRCVSTANVGSRDRGHEATSQDSLPFYLTTSTSHF